MKGGSLRTKAAIEKKRAYNREYYRKNAERLRQRRRERYAALSEAERRRHSKAVGENRKTKRKELPGYRRAYNAWNRAYRCLRLPKWVSLDDFLPIYAKLGEREDLVMDHILPLRGELICGLHVPSNLRIIPKKDNQSKGNSFEPFEE